MVADAGGSTGDARGASEEEATVHRAGRLTDGPALLRIVHHEAARGGSSRGCRPDEEGVSPPEPRAADPADVPLEVASSYRRRTRGLLGRDRIEGAMLLTPASSVHTFRMRFTLDVAHLDRTWRVLSVRTMPPGRLGVLHLRARHVLEAEAGAMRRWGLRPGDRVRVLPPPE